MKLLSGLKAPAVAVLLASLCFASVPPPRVTNFVEMGNPPKLQSISMRFESVPKGHDFHGNEYDTLEPYIAYKLTVVQIAGGSHKNHTLVVCTPFEATDPVVDSKTGEVAKGQHLGVSCEDGSVFIIAGIVFDQK